MLGKNTRIIRISKIKNNTTPTILKTNKQIEYFLTLHYKEHVNMMGQNIINKEKETDRTTTKKEDMRRSENK